MATFSMDPYTMENFQLNLLAGRNFNSNQKSDELESFIINEKALKSLGYENPSDVLNQEVDFIKSGEIGDEVISGKVIGVIEDFHYEFVIMESGPLVINYDPASFSTISIKVNARSEAQAIASIEGVWESFDKVHPFEYETYEYSISDIDDEYDELVSIIGLVSFIAILIACLGQFSMVVHHVQLKVKEIGIRKVLGSNLGHLMYRLSKGFLIVILLAIICSTPIAWKINHLWTSRIYSSPELSFVNVSIGVFFILLMAFITIFFLVRRAVNANPVEALKYE